MKTDLGKILSVSGHHGLYRYLSQARNGAIAESLADGKKTMIDLHSRITTLADISIFTSEGEIKLNEVFVSMQKVLGDKLAPAAKNSDAELKSLFEQAIPDYDRDRFYVSHMKKVADWYNDLVQFASLDFETPQEPEENTEPAAEEA